MDKLRKPFRGVWNIIRFNWHFYVLSVALALIVLALKNYFNTPLTLMLDIPLMLILYSTFISLLISCYVYDFSQLYTFSWLNESVNKDDRKILNINAGFDETSSLLKNKYPTAELEVFDFYNPAKHTELSIKRARRAYPPFPGTRQVSFNYLPLEENSVDKIFAILSAHEIRDDKERVVFFKELHRVLREQGKIIVTEHLRDTNNFFAYTIGFFHFYSKRTWLSTFHNAGFIVNNEIKITPFITTFILAKNGIAS